MTCFVKSAALGVASPIPGFEGDRTDTGWLACAETNPKTADSAHTYQHMQAGTDQSTVQEAMQVPSNSSIAQELWRPP